MSRRGAPTRGFTLVELMVAIALATIIVGILASVSIQAQRAIAVSAQREDASRTAIAILGDVERDVAALVPACAVPLPFPTTDRALQLERLEGPATGGGDCRDRLRLFTTVRALDGQADLVRGMVEWQLQPRVVDEALGPPRGVLTRHVMVWARAGDPTTTAGPAPATAAQDVVSFEVEWQDAAANGEYKPAGAAGSSVADGSLWVRDGKVDITDTPNGTLATATAGAADLDALPIGAEVSLVQPAGAPLLMLIRRRLTGSGKVLFHDRAPPAAGVTFTAFRGPPALRVSVVVPFGTGPEAGTARFSRTFPVPR